ncbi:GIY-YIG nuclease family protein [Clostridium gasigenes]|uniref:GIY-YIG nuclease family protein n=1 Tax=Clostridium gasigenes TaxID=94869 RepID=UPI001623D628|nr:GIY-YIG nuclease family protein [Clostridium gasigenes]MBB6623502.1 GIY-YIG nuclease family protein [Clostridium gasigenes]
MNCVYILKCSDDTLYTGWTNDLDKRFKVHSQGKGAKYTKGRLPVELVYFEEFDNKIEAMKREYEVKQLSRKEKQKLIIENGYKKKIDKKSESNIIEL